MTTRSMSGSRRATLALAAGLGLTLGACASGTTAGVMTAGGTTAGAVTQTAGG